MKSIKYVLLGALLLSGTAPVMAQNNAAIEQVKALLKDKPAKYNDQINDIYKANKKDANTIAAIGNAYLNAKDTANAAKYADLALKKDVKCAKAYILKGDIAVLADDGGKAAEMYQQAKYFAPKDPEGYYKYAMILRGRSPEEAVANLEDLRAQVPDYPVDAMAARIYYKSLLYEKALASYDKVDKSKLTDDDITDYSIAAWLLQKRDKAIAMATYGLTRNPRRPAWNRINFYCYTDNKNTEQALNYADRLFNQSDSAHFTGEDYTYYGTALLQAKKYDDAIAAFQKSAEFNKDNATQLNIVNKNLADAYLAKNDYDNAVSYYQKYLSGKSNPSAYDIAGLGTIYQQIASARMEAKDMAGAKAAFDKADAVYADLEAKHPLQADFCNYMRARIQANLDPDTKTGLAKPFYDKLVSSIEAKTTKDEVDTSRLTEAYRYLGYYYYLKKNKAESDSYFRKLLQIDPNNSIAKQALGIK